MITYELSSIPLKMISLSLIDSYDYIEANNDYFNLVNCDYIATRLLLKLD